MHRETETLCDLPIVVLALLQWSGTEPQYLSIPALSNSNISQTLSFQHIINVKINNGIFCILCFSHLYSELGAHSHFIVASGCVIVAKSRMIPNGFDNGVWY